ncbi:hypothetical protein C0033_05805 [Clostridium sp. chh4-2]|nr:hypothetical protein C0033_05805 [Clostridium sp. chh4-2]
MNKYKDFLNSISTFLISLIIQKLLSRIGVIKTENIAIDLISWLIIFSCVYILMTIILKK